MMKLKKNYKKNLKQIHNNKKMRTAIKIIQKVRIFFNFGWVEKKKFNRRLTATLMTT